MITSVVWASMLDWPGEICTTLFFNRCNMNCIYCHNKKLAQLPPLNLESIIKKLVERQSVINHIILSGGECTFSKDFYYICDRLKMLNFKIGIHTNGLEYNKIASTIGILDFIAIDIKTTPNNFKELTGIELENFSKYDKLIDLILLLNVPHEFRTTILPYYTNKKDITSIANFLKNKRY